MFLQFFQFFLDCITSIFKVAKKLELMRGFTYFDLMLALFFVTTIVSIIKFVKQKGDD